MGLAGAPYGGGGGSGCGSGCGRRASSRINVGDDDSQVIVPRYPTVPCSHRTREGLCRNWAKRLHSSLFAASPGCKKRGIDEAVACCTSRRCNNPGKMHECSRRGHFAQARCNMEQLNPLVDTCYLPCLRQAGSTCNLVCGGTPGMGGGGGVGQATWNVFYSCLVGLIYDRNIARKAAWAKCAKLAGITLGASYISCWACLERVQEICDDECF